MITQRRKEILTIGLRNAHAMEKEALAMLRPQLERITNYPAVADQIARHITETEGQVARLQQILEELGEDTSMVKDVALSIMGSLAATGNALAPDEILKASFANVAFENYEIVAYKSLIVLAKDADCAFAVPALQTSLAQEQAMSEWLHDNIEKVTLNYVALRSAGEDAKI